MDRKELTRVLASLTEDEYQEIVTEARGGADQDVKSLLLREMSSRGMALNDDESLIRAAFGGE